MLQLDIVGRCELSPWCSQGVAIVTSIFQVEKLCIRQPVP